MNALNSRYKTQHLERDHELSVTLMDEQLKKTRFNQQLEMYYICKLLEYYRGNFQNYTCICKMFV